MSISPDDPGLFGYDGVGNDWFWILMKTDLKASEIYLLLKVFLEIILSFLLLISHFCSKYSAIPQVVANKEILINQVAQDLHYFFNRTNTLHKIEFFPKISIFIVLIYILIIFS